VRRAHPDPRELPHLRHMEEPFFQRFHGVLQPLCRAYRQSPSGSPIDKHETVLGASAEDQSAPVASPP
jgi:hypothetical protein